MCLRGKIRDTWGRGGAQTKKLLKRTRTCPECRKCSEELTKQQLFAQNLLEVLLAFHREALRETENMLKLMQTLKQKNPL